MPGAVLLAAVLVIGFSSQAHASQAEPEYTFDGSRIFWFVQITDTHVDNILPGSEPRITWALMEGIPVVAPDFVVNTGDLTDSTNGIIYGTGPHEEEWIRYRLFLEEAGLTPDYYYDLPGNHDQYGDENLSYYRQYSMWGSSTGRTQPHWRMEYPFGTYLFFGAATPGNDGAQWPFDHPTFTYWELEELDRVLLEHGEDADLIFLFGHHDYVDVEQHDLFLEAVHPYGPPRFYSHGHEHDHEATLDTDGILRYRIDSLGQSRHNNFAVWAVDANAVSIGVWDAQDAWPAILITAPVDAQLLDVDNPYAPVVPNRCARAPVRALVFDAEEVEWAHFRWDEGWWYPMSPRLDRPQQWRGYYDSTMLSPGLHQLTVSASGSRIVTQTIQVLVEDTPCALGEEDPDLDPVEPDEGLDLPADAGTDLDAGDSPDLGTDHAEGLDDEVDGGDDALLEGEEEIEDRSTSEPDSLEERPDGVLVDSGEPEDVEGEGDAPLTPGNGERIGPDPGCGCRASPGGLSVRDWGLWGSVILLTTRRRRRAVFQRRG